MMGDILDFVVMKIRPRAKTTIGRGSKGTGARKGASEDETVRERGPERGRITHKTVGEWAENGPSIFRSICR